MDRWRGKIAVVTGASAGIGAEVATKLVEQGMLVVGLARRAERVKSLAKQLSDKDGKLYAIRVDITREANLLEAFKWITENLGPVHVLVNCAGIVQDTTLMSGSTERWRRTLETNVLGLCVATREAISIMRSHNIDGHIVHINSVLGHSTSAPPNVNIFPASKHAVTALTETLRQELIRAGTNIKVSSISPGLVSSELQNSIRNKSVNSEILQILRDAPALEAEDVADAVLYVLGTPPHVQVHEMIVRPVGRSF